MVVFLFAFLQPTSAQGVIQGGNENTDTLGIETIDQNIGLTGMDIRLVAVKIIRAVLGLLGIIVLGLVLYAGYTIMTSGGNEEKVQQGKKILINAVIGLIIIMSAFAIVQFIINMLSGNGGRFGNDNSSRPRIETFAGSGSLGKIIRDHYPMRGQTGVKRNTKVMITFADAIDPSTIIENTNNTCWAPDGSPTSTCPTGAVPYYGDCLVRADFDWGRDCDHLISNNLIIYKTDDTTKTPVESAAMTTYNADRDAFTFVFKPLSPLGSDEGDVWYTVTLDNDIKRKTGEGAFDSQFYKYYTWQFQTDTGFDFTPPYVVSVDPVATDNNISKNTIIQIMFNEAMDPTAVQGVLDGTGLFNNLVFHSVSITGEWQVSNGYTTVEFVSDQPCGINSCGGTIYCLQLDCSPIDTDCSEDFQTLIRTAAKLSGGQSFEALPFSGVMDAAGNALDGNEDDIAQTKPPMPGTMEERAVIGLGEETADNYLWSYNVKNKIDNISPYVQKVYPGLDEGSVSKDAVVEINFSRKMRSYNFSDIQLDQHPDVVDDLNIDFAFWVRSIVSENNKTIGRIYNSSGFGSNGANFYYFPQVPSSIVSTNFNCLYPGRGPVRSPSDINFSPTCVVGEYDENGNPIASSIQNCVNVSNVSSTIDTGCIDVSDVNVQATDSVTSCLNYLQRLDVSPIF
ncbi:MAG: Ig-like domain-containing protein [Candidatus Magasanikiibacteriota bacterium]